MIGIDFTLSLKVMLEHILHNQRGNYMKNTDQKEGEDPLNNLYQMDDYKCTLQEKEALLLVGRILENVEEYYALQAQINKVVASDPVIQSKITYMLQTLIKGITIEQTLLSTELLLM